MSRTSEERVLRTIGLLFGLGGAIFGLLDMPAVLDQLSADPPAFTAAGVAATIGLPVALGVAAPFVSARTIRVLGALVAAGNLLTLAVLPLVMRPDSSVAESPWALQLTALGTTGAALALPATFVAIDVLLTGAFVVLDRWVTAPGPLGLIPLQDGLYATLFTAIFAGLAIGALRAARAVDAATVEAVTAMRSARDERVHADERARVNALVHDHVLTALLVAARSQGPTAGGSAAAADALARLQRVALASDGDEPVTPYALLDRLRAQLTAVAPDAGFSIDGDRTTPVPARIADALVGAAAEALRNTQRHAGAGAGVELHAALADDCIELAVVDDGVGFVRTAVPPNRLGIAASIESRMHGVGGSAHVRSTPGRGTAVRLVWADR